jgi:hypothetical protein
VTNGIFRGSKQAIRGGTPVVVHHRNTTVTVQGGGKRNQRVVVATWTDGPVSRDTDPLTQEQADELVKLGAENDRDPEAMVE